MKPKYIEVVAGVRYWEDAIVNGVVDTDGTLIPFRRGQVWNPLIDLETGRIVDWPSGTNAEIHYKVCDDGEYWLLDSDMESLAYHEGYVPDEYLCHGESGYGDYIIMNIDSDGYIQNYSEPKFVPENWKIRVDSPNIL